MKIKTQLHTIFMLVGPTECGKSTFTKNILIPQLEYSLPEKNYFTNVQYLSSDAIRQEILGYNYDKYDEIMMESSGQAFHLLGEKLKMVTSYPVNAEFVIVDTTGLALEFRNSIIETAQKNHYNLEVIIFDYKDRDEYYKSERSRKTITKHIQRLKQEVLPSLSKEKYNQIHRIKSKVNKKEDFEVEISDMDTYTGCLLDENTKYIIVGDVHECVETLQKLIISYGFSIENGKIKVPADKKEDMKFILLGDWIDKGKKTREITEFLYENKEHFIFLKGNHENFVYNKIMGKIKGTEQEIIDNFFDSISVFEKDSELFEKFGELFSESKPFVKRIGFKGSSFIVTHAPVKTKYLGKLDSKSQRKQRVFRLEREKPTEEQLKFLEEEAVRNNPYHIFGHVAAKNAFIIKNKYHLDTGAVYKNKLTSLVINGFRPVYGVVDSHEGNDSEKLEVLFKKRKNVNINELSDNDIYKLNYTAENHINFISGTMSPSDKDIENNKLESLKNGLGYFLENSIDKVVLQPKYMGSRCTLYLFAEREQCFAVSRNGYKIKSLDLEKIYISMHEKFSDYMKNNKIKMMILDGELMPWTALGKELIETKFRPIAKALEIELEFLRENRFEDELFKVTKEYHKTDFKKDQTVMAKKELKEKYGDSVYQNYKMISSIEKSLVPLEKHINAGKIYKKQVELYGTEGEITYKPFDLLKIVYENGKEEIPNWKTSEKYSFLSDDEYVTVDLKTPDCYKTAEDYYNRMTIEKRMEGIVIKPEIIKKGKAPYIKVRNPEYLSIIYGYDYLFPHKYEKLIKQKNIRKKLKTSVNEYELGQELLKIPFYQIKKENLEFRQTAANLLFEVSQEKDIDPRL
jgi:predicted kinase